MSRQFTVKKYALSLTEPDYHIITTIYGLGNNTSQQLGKKFNLISAVIMVFSLMITMFTSAYADTPAIPHI